MALLFLALLAATLLFLFYYELLWKKSELERGQSLISTAKDFFLRDRLQVRAIPATSNAWDDWKYRLTTELHRREQINLEDAAQVVGVSAQDVEQYLDELEGEGKVRQMGDAERGIFYKIVTS